MTDKPISFSALMVRAILEGRKTMTRRIMEPQPNGITYEIHEHSQVPSIYVPYTKDGRLNNSTAGNIKNSCEWKCPYGQVGDHLWVREMWAQDMDGEIFYAADEYLSMPPTIDKWRPSIFMPRAASRITLQITNIRGVERLQDISEDDAKAEGINLSLEQDLNFHKLLYDLTSGGMATISATRATFGYMWDSINKKNPWDSNPWVWVINFKISYCGRPQNDKGETE